MIKRTLICISLLACVAVASAQDEMAEARKMAKDLFAKSDAYINKGQAAKFFAQLTSDYYNVDTEGRRSSLAEFKGMITGMMKETKDVHMKTTVMNVQLMNDEEVVWTEMVLTFSVKAGSKWMKMKETMRFAENLRKVDGQWKIASSQELMTNEPWTFKTTN